MKLTAVAVARKHDPRGVGRPACTVAFIPAGAVRESRDSSPVRVHDVELFVAVAVALEQDLGADPRPSGAKIASQVVVGKVCNVAPIRVNGEHYIVAVPGADERGPAAAG